MHSSKKFFAYALISSLGLAAAAPGAYATEVLLNSVPLGSGTGLNAYYDMTIDPHSTSTQSNLLVANGHFQGFGAYLMAGDLVKGGKIHEVASNELLANFKPSLVKLNGPQITRWPLGSLCPLSEERQALPSKNDAGSTLVSVNIDSTCLYSSSASEEEQRKENFRQRVRAFLGHLLLDQVAASDPDRAAIRSARDNFADVGRALYVIRRKAPNARVMLMNFMLPPIWATNVIPASSSGRINHYVRAIHPATVTGIDIDADSVTKTRIRNYSIFLTELLRFIDQHAFELAGVDVPSGTRANIELMELANEPQGPWNAYFAPNDFAQFIVGMHAEIGAYLPSYRNKIVGPATGPAEAPRYLDALIAANALGDMAGVSAHAWEERSSNTIRPDLSSITSTNALAEKAALAGKDLYLTEFNNSWRQWNVDFPSVNGGYLMNQNKNSSVRTASDYAKFGVAAMEAALANLESGARGLVYWEAQDHSFSDSTYGLMKEDRLRANSGAGPARRRPAYFAFQMAFRGIQAGSYLYIPQVRRPFAARSHQPSKDLDGTLDNHIRTVLFKSKTSTDGQLLIVNPGLASQADVSVVLPNGLYVSELGSIELYEGLESVKISTIAPTGRLNGIANGFRLRVPPKTVIRINLKVRNFSRVTSGYDVIVIAGQSNAAGAGMGPYTVDYPQNDDRIAQLGRAWYGHPYDNMSIIPLNSADRPRDVLEHVNYDGRYQRAIGFATSFARRLAINIPMNRKVLLVPVAKGGASIRYLDGYMNLNDSSDNNTDLYNDMVSRISFALDTRGSRFLGFLWQQGEADIQSAAAGRSYMPNENFYAQTLMALLVSLRSGFASHGPFPILIGEPPQSFGYGDASVMNMRSRFVLAQHQLALAPELPNVRVVSSAGLLSNAQQGTHPSDYTHFSAVSATELGERYFVEISRLLP